MAVTEIADLLLVGRSTLYRALKEDRDGIAFAG
jgi:hypothetical protein